MCMCMLRYRASLRKLGNEAVTNLVFGRTFSEASARTLPVHAVEAIKLLLVKKIYTTCTVSQHQGTIGGLRPLLTEAQ